jgi:hypothetical protein
MKRIGLVFLFLFLFLPLRAESDEIVWKGQSLGILYEQPIARLEKAFRDLIDSRLFAEDGGHVYVGEGSLYESCFYQSCWSVSDNRLCLDSIGLFERIDGKDIRVFRSAEWLKDLFREYWQDGHIVASWFTGTFKGVPYDVRPIELSGGHFYTTWEKEWVFEFREGELVSTRFDDHLVHEGSINLRSWHLDESFPQVWYAFPVERFPALAGCKFRVLITNGILDDTGRMVDFTPVLRGRPMILDEDPVLEAALIAEIKKRLLSVDWTIYRIGDEYTPGRMDGAVAPFELTFPADLQQVSPE